MNSSCLLWSRRTWQTSWHRKHSMHLRNSWIAVDVALRHPPGAVGCVGRARLEFLDPLLDAEVPRDVGDEILDRRKRAHRFHRHGLPEVQLAQPRHAHQPRVAVDLRRAGAALARLAVPPDREIGRLLRLDPMHDVEDDHPFRHLRVERLERPVAFRTRAPDLERGVSNHDFCSSITCFSSSGIGAIGTRDTCIAPPACFTMTLMVLNSACLSG